LSFVQDAPSLTAFCPDPDQSNPRLHSVSWKSTLILLSLLHLSFLSVICYSGLPTKTLYAPILSSIRTTSPARLFLLDFLTPLVFSKKYRSWSSSLWISSSLLLRHLSLAHVYSSAPWCHTPSACFLPVLWQTIFYTQLHSSNRSIFSSHFSWFCCLARDATAALLTLRVQTDNTPRYCIIGGVMSALDQVLEVS